MRRSAPNWRMPPRCIQRMLRQKRLPFGERQLSDAAGRFYQQESRSDLWHRGDPCFLRWQTGFVLSIFVRMSHELATIHTDGAARGNPGPAACRVCHRANRAAGGRTCGKTRRRDQQCRRIHRADAGPRTVRRAWTAPAGDSQRQRTHGQAIQRRIQRQKSGPEGFVR